MLRASLRPVAAKLGHLTSDQLSQDHIDEYARQRLAQRRWEGDKRFEGKETGTVGQSTVDKDLRMLRACLNDAMRRRYIPAALPFKIASPDFAARDEWLTPGEVERMLDLCERRTVEGTKKTVWLDRNYLRGFILISAATGARKSAVLSLKWDQVYIPRPEDVPKGELVYNFATDTAGGRPYIDFGTAVGNKHRPTFPIGHSPALLRWLLFEADRESEYVITRHGKPLADVKKGLAALLADAGISKDVTPHSLKHTAITWMVQANVPFSTIADLTKTSEKILKKHYSHHRPDYHAQLAELPRLNA